MAMDKAILATVPVDFAQNKLREAGLEPVVIPPNTIASASKFQLWGQNGVVQFILMKNVFERVALFVALDEAAINEVLGKRIPEIET